MSRRIRFRITLTLGLVLGASLPGSAQELPTLDPADYGQWEYLNGFSLDPAGEWLVSSIQRVDETVELRLTRADGSGDARILEHASAPSFSPDGRWMAYRKGKSPEEAESADGPSRDRLGLVNLRAGSDTVLMEMRGFEFRGDGAWLAVLGFSPSDSVGADLLVMRPDGSNRTVLGNVDTFAWQDDGDLLAATLETAWRDANGVVLLDPEPGVLRTLDARDADYAGLTWDESSARLGVRRSRDREGRLESSHDILVWEDVRRDDAPQILEGADRAELGDTLRIAVSGGIDFADDGETIYLGVQPWEADPEAGDEAGDAEGEDGESDEPADEGDDPEDSPDEVDEADVQVWHWDDDLIIRAQEWRASFLAGRTLATAWHRADDRVVVLGTELEEPVVIPEEGRWGLVPDYTPYLFQRRFGSGAADWYRVDLRTGERTLASRALPFGPRIAPSGEWALLFDGERWTALSLESMEPVPVDPEGQASFGQSLEDYDYPGDRPAWGIGGWSEDGDEAWLNDRHDVWRVDLASGGVERATRGAEEGTQFRLADPDPEAPPFGAVEVPSDREAWYSVRHLRSKASGYARGRPGQVRTLVMEDALVTMLRKGVDSDRYAFRMGRWDDSPDVFTASASLANPVQVTTTNPFQKEYAWGRAELVEYTTDAGLDLQGILIYPANFREGERYPLILYQYERLSDGLHSYRAPNQRDYYNQQVWSQEGYFVLLPDIVYEPGRPGPSALDAVEHALDAALATGHVDPDGLGLIGHSWGGYQAAYLPTRTDRFAASVAGAAITDFISFMGAVHWNGGLPETGHWETGQARMARPAWEDLEGHLESSPVNFINELETPVLLMHGDADGVVDFRQGLEYYNYARRAGKPVVLLVYPGADHGLREESHQVDYHRRILEWFGHWLKGEPAPGWVTDGESWPEREKRLGG
jgi:dipeptidyl aminopeptidase/acylaminoacyl peptidase